MGLDNKISEIFSAIQPLSAASHETSDGHVASPDPSIFLEENVAVDANKQKKIAERSISVKDLTNKLLHLRKRKSI